MDDYDDDLGDPARAWDQDHVDAQRDDRLNDFWDGLNEGEDDESPGVFVAVTSADGSPTWPLWMPLDQVDNRDGTYSYPRRSVADAD